MFGCFIFLDSVQKLSHALWVPRQLAVLRLCYQIDVYLDVDWVYVDTLLSRAERFRLGLIWGYDEYMLALFRLCDTNVIVMLLCWGEEFWNSSWVHLFRCWLYLICREEFVSFWESQFQGDKSLFKRLFQRQFKLFKVVRNHAGNKIQRSKDHRNIVVTNFYLRKIFHLIHPQFVVTDTPKWRHFFEKSNIIGHRRRTEIFRVFEQIFQFANFCCKTP